MLAKGYGAAGVQVCSAKLPPYCLTYFPRLNLYHSATLASDFLRGLPRARVLVNMSRILYPPKWKWFFMKYWEVSKLKIKIFELKPSSDIHCENKHTRAKNVNINEIGGSVQKYIG